MVGENKVSLSHIDRMSRLGCVCPPCHDGPYVRYVGFQRELHFLSTIRLFSDSYGYY